MPPVSPLEERRWALFLDVGRRVVPPLAGLLQADLDRFGAIVVAALAGRPPAIRRQFAVFLSAIRWAPVLRYGAPFTRLSAERKDEVLRWLMDAPFARLRSGFWGLRALVFMGYYGRPEAWPAVRYAPSFDGNGKLHA